ETRFEEFRSAKLLCDALEEEGFTVERGVAGLRV
ncbi:aminobenzoyl-glutamate utilization protein B, partial [Halobacillus karajensis]